MAGRSTDLDQELIAGRIERLDHRGLDEARTRIEAGEAGLVGSYVMATAEHREPYESRGSRTVLGARGGAIPPRDST